MNEQIDLFSYSMPTFKIDKPIRLIELFAGIGSQAKALENLGVPFEPWFISEIDKYAIASYNAVHGTNFEPNDIQEIHAADLKIAERELLLYTYLLIPMPRLESCRKSERHDQGERNTKRSFVGSGKDFGRMRRTTASIADGKRSSSCRKEKHKRLPIVAVETRIARIFQLCSAAQCQRLWNTTEQEQMLHGFHPRGISLHVPKEAETQTETKGYVRGQRGREILSLTGNGSVLHRQFKETGRIRQWIPL